LDLPAQPVGIVSLTSLLREGENTMAKTLTDHFYDQLQDAYNAVTQLTKALPKLAKAAGSPDLRSGFEQHLKETHNQVARLEQVCQQVGWKTG